MKTLLIILCLILVKEAFSQSSVATTFVVKGDADKFYPVVFDENSTYWYYGTTELEITRSDVHINSQWRGSLIAKFRVHTTRWGHGANFIDAEIRSGGGQYAPFIAGWKDATISNGTTSFIIWLRGGSTTYYYRSLNSPIGDPKVYDGIQNNLPFTEVNGENHTYKTQAESYVNQYGMTYGGSVKFMGGIQNELNLGKNWLKFDLDVKDFNNLPRINIPENSLKIWDSYQSNGPTSYGTMMEIYGRGAHMTCQLYFGGWDNSRIRYREAFYNQNTWNPWITLLDSKNDIESTGNLKISGNGIHTISNGNVLIGKTSQNNNTYKLEVEGKVRANEIVVNTSGADFVFDSSYILPSLQKVEEHIKENGYLPNVPSAAQMQNEGIGVSEMQTILLQKVEELTLYMIELKKENDILKKEIKELKK